MQEILWVLIGETVENLPLRTLLSSILQWGGTTSFFFSISAGKEGDDSGCGHAPTG